MKYYPSMAEVMTAGRIFKAEMILHAAEVEAGNMSIDTAVDICAAKVWSEARKYQDDQNSRLIMNSNRTNIE